MKTEGVKRVDFYVALVVFSFLACVFFGQGLNAWTQANKWHYTSVESTPCRIDRVSGRLEVWSRQGWHLIGETPPQQP